MMEYDGELHIPRNFLVPPPNITKTSGEFLAHNGISTFACSESQKIGCEALFRFLQCSSSASCMLGDRRCLLQTALSVQTMQGAATQV